jgi:response regulator RpfG family c-di-GMP phosphodiesterase
MLAPGPAREAPSWGGPPRTVLLLDDEPMILRAEARALRGAGLAVVSTTDPRHARRLVELESPHVVISDLHMPAACGARFLMEVGEVAPHALRLLLSADPDFRPRIGALSEARVHALMGKLELGHLPRLVVDLLVARDASVGAELDPLDVASRLARAMARPSHEDDGHRHRLSAWTARLLRVMGASEADVHVARLGAVLHDIGQMTVPSHVFARAGELTPADRHDLRLHPGAGARVLADLPALHAAIPLVAVHQERHDGSGYPAGLKGDAIPLIGRAFHVVDTYEAITSGRPYRSPRSHADALTELSARAGKELDPEAIRAFAGLSEAELGSALTA